MEMTKIDTQEIFSPPYNLVEDESIAMSVVLRGHVVPSEEVLIYLF